MMTSLLSDTHIDPPLDIQGPITRARTRQLNLEVSSFRSTPMYDYVNMMLSNNYIVIRNHGEQKEMLGEGLGGVEGQLMEMLGDALIKVHQIAQEATTTSIQEVTF